MGILGNIIDYVRQYGHLSFEEKPFDKIDALILSQFSYFKLGEHVPSVGTMLPSVSIEQIAASETADLLFSDGRFRKNNRDLFDAMASSKRFSGIKLNHYVDIVTDRWEMQFSAVTAQLSEDVTHIAFRGTDESIVGWKEDFNMAYMTPVPAQIKAVDYLNYAAERIKGDFSVGGHSKGGNLAVYCAMKCPEDVRRRITRIYSHDGPGFPKQTLTESDFEAIKDRIEKYVPRSSIVGMLLQSQEQYKVIEAYSVGILQHDPFNWVVEGDDFIYRDDVAGRYEISDASVNEWAKRADPEEMKVLVDKIYEIFTVAEITDLNDFKGNITTLMQKAGKVLYRTDKEDRKRIKEVLSVFVSSVKDQIKEHVTR